MQPIPPAKILEFWQDAGPEAWFAADPEFDARIATAFGTEVGRACERLARGPHPWESAARSTLALLILTDQFPRNIYRGLSAAWACDRLALGVARRALGAGLDKEMGGAMRIFFYLPFCHSETMEDQDRSVSLIAEAFGDGEFLRHARAHRRVIRKFGEFPERNAILGRPTSEEEQRWIRQGGYGGELARGGE